MTRTAPLVLVLLFALSACTSPGGAGDADPERTGASAPASQPAAGREAQGPKPRRPKVGQCYRHRFRDALSRTSARPPVPCRRRHTAVTFHVGELPRPQGRRPAPATSPRVRREVARTCQTRLAPFLGAEQEELRLSMLTPVWFTPSTQDVERGASWFRCDVVVLGPSRSLVPLPGTLRDAYQDAEVVRRLAMCATAAPGTSGFRRVPCGQGHSWRAVRSVDLTGDTYPGSDRVSSLEDACAAAARAEATDPLDVTWAQEVPSRERWRAGQRHGLCWVPTS